MVEDSSVVTTEVMTEGTIEEEIAVAIGIVQSAITTISHSVTNATVARLNAQAVAEIPVAVTAEATEVATGETIVAVTDAIIAEVNVEEIAEGIGIALSAKTTTSHSVTSATVVRLSAQAVAEIPVAVTAEVTEVATGETIVAVTDAIIAEETVEEIAEGIGIALSARTTTSHFVTSATVAKQIVRAEVALVVEATEVAHATVETAEVRDPQIHAMVAAEEELLEAAADRADQDSEAQVVAASVATDRAEAAVDVESAPPQHSSRLLVSSAYGAKRGDALDRCA